MPCNDGPPPPFDLFEARKRINQLTGFMCEAVYLLRRANVDFDDFSTPAQAWIRNHKREDERRKAFEEHFKEAYRTGLEKLSNEERLALNVDRDGVDWPI